MAKTIADGIKEHDVYTGKLSDVCRPLAFAGIGVLWLIKTTDKPVPGLNWTPILLLPLVLFVFALTLDIVQYGYYSIYWYIWTRAAEKENKRLKASGQLEKLDFRVPSAVHWFGNFCFYGKALVILLGYVFLLIWLGRSLSMF